MPVGPILLVAALGMLLGLVTGRFAPRVWLASTVVGAAAGLAASAAVLCGAGDWDWRSGAIVGGEPLHLHLDGIGALFLALVSVLGGAGAVYAREYWPDRAHPRSARAGRLWWSVLVASLGFVLLSANGLHFLIAWELFTLSAYFLITLDRANEAVRAAGWLYLAASHVAVLCLFAFFALMAARTGSWELGPLRERADLAPLFWLALVGFGLKAGLFPLHVWLPSAHASAPSQVSALLSGVTIKLGIYGLVRFSSWLPVPASAGWVVAALGTASAVLGVAFALGQHDLKRLLAYHSVENIGIILIGLGFALVAVRSGNPAWGRLALAGGLLHVWNHGLFKALLFLGAGSVLHATGTREMSRLGGLWRAMPWTTALFALGAFAICGLPPLNGFVSEWLVYSGLLGAASSHSASFWGAIPAAILLGMTGALALACFVKVCGVVFLGAPRSESSARAHECGPLMRGAMLVLAAACVTIGLAPSLFWPMLERVVGAWQPAWSGAGPPTSLAVIGRVHVLLALLAAAAAWWLARRVRARTPRRVPTWDCAYAAPTARMQYTAGSFAATLVEGFAWILRPVRHATPPIGAFPSASSFETHTPETVLEHIAVPIGNFVMRVAIVARRLQHGRVQAYVLYLLVGLAALTGVVLLGAN
ncbi:MAG: NADH-quinone oxidoreductase subunit H [Planctomycetes bacterium]|nr:NADH-quinone oxidoreductase subunit H [Planctomycetota bacterium]